MKSIVIKAAAPADVETLVSLRLEMRREREEVPLQVSEAEFEAALREFFAETIAAGTFVSFIAWDGETAAACSGLSLEVQPPSYGNLSGRVGYVTNMYTRPAYRGQGLARKLLESGFLDPMLRVRYIREVAQKARLTGCVLYTHGFGRCSLADRPLNKLLRAELEKIGMPLLVLEGDCMDSSIDPCSTVTKISSFVEALNLKKYGNLFGMKKL